MGFYDVVGRVVLLELDLEVQVLFRPRIAVNVVAHSMLNWVTRSD